jgi:hypothetical protein
MKFYLHFLVNLKFYLHFCGNLKFCHFQFHFLITAAVEIGAAGKGKKRIFLCERFLPPGEASDVRIWGGRSPRPPLELVVADFLIATATNSVHATRIGVAGKEKKRIFLCVRFPPRAEAGDVKIWGGALFEASSRTCHLQIFYWGRVFIVVSKFLIPIPTH